MGKSKIVSVDFCGAIKLWDNLAICDFETLNVDEIDVINGVESGLYDISLEYDGNIRSIVIKHSNLPKIHLIRFRKTHKINYKTSIGIIGTYESVVHAFNNPTILSDMYKYTHISPNCAIKESLIVHRNSPNKNGEIIKTANIQTVNYNGKIVAIKLKIV